MFLTSTQVNRADFETASGWQIKPEGACKGEICIPLSQSGDTLDAETLARDMNLPLVHEPEAGAWALGPESIGGRSLATAEAPNMILPDLDGNLFELHSLRGQKIVVYAWAPY